ncbi:hypothetical protein [Staphylococcus saprophyticus]|uniref:hypothetical protein n=1 Tax=Staphylococcus saprophyticus TaxID=29385 RepID=UPI00085358A0|nr:hypothetical protein [Staphylococcus saprophyticus]OEK44585.1 hypothetical protein ASS92_10965 [Staphylococcus saprophyticus]
MNEVEQVKQKILDYIGEHKEIPIYKLEELFKDIGFDYKGKKMLTSSENEYKVFWRKWNAEACTIICDLALEDKVKFVISRQSVMLYLLDGKCVDLPLAVTDELETHSWVPITLKLA